MFHHYTAEFQTTMKKSSQLERLRSKFGDQELWESGSKHAERDLGFISSAGVFDEDGVMLSEPWSDALFFAPVVDEAIIAKREASSENRKKEQVIFWPKSTFFCFYHICIHSA